MNLRKCSALMAVLFMLNFAGCDSIKDKNKCDVKDNVTAERMTYKNSNISVEEVKGKYDADNEMTDRIMPLYNVNKDEEFIFKFKCDLTADSSIGLYDVVTVHTDKECKDESKIYYYSSIDKSSDGSVVKISPMEPILKTKTDSDNYVDKNKCTWGSAPMLYLAIHYEQYSDRIRKLNRPIVIPFTVKSEVEVPNVKAVIGTDGVYRLEWDPVEGADHYTVYNLTNADIIAGKNNDEIDGEKNAYKGSSLLKIADTTDTEFAGFSGEKDGVVTMRDGAYVIGQNYNVSGTYYVTAVSGDKESNLSAPCKTVGLKLPCKVEDSQDISNLRYKDVSELPLEIDVRNIDDSVSRRKVLYKLQPGNNTSVGSRAEYKYSIEGTAITGFVVLNDYENPNKEYPETIGTESSSGNYVPEDNIKKSPDSSVDTIIGDKNKKDKDDNLVDSQIENTKSHKDSGKDTKTETPEKGVYINAESPEEEWLALNMAAGNEDISLEAFPKLQDPYVLKDTFYKVYYQNPFILGICAFAYDYNTFNFKVEYSYSKDEIKKRQKELVEKAAKINDEIIKDGMSDDEKQFALAVKEALSKKGMESKLKEAGYVYNNGFLVLNFNAGNGNKSDN